MKKISLLLIFILTIFLTACGKNNLENLSYKDLTNKLNEKESFIIYFGSDDDTELAKKLNTVLESNNLTGYKFDPSDLTEEEKNTLSIAIAYEDPSIVFVVEGRDPSKLTHVTDKDIIVKNLEQRLKDLGFIK